MTHYAENQQSGAPAATVGQRPSSDGSSDSGRAQHLRYSGIVPRRLMLAKSHQGARQYFDSAEWACSLQGVVLQDLLPGGAPLDARPVKLEPTRRAHLGPSTLTLEASGHLAHGDRIPAFTPQFSTCDY